jgi:hypothetical protein
MYKWFIVHDRYMHRCRLADDARADDDPLRYRLLIETPAWAAPMCRAIAHESGAPTKLVHHLRGSFAEMSMGGEIKVGDTPLMRTTVRYQHDGQSVVCRYAGYASPGRYQGLLTNAAAHMDQTVAQHQKRLDDRVRAAALLGWLAARLAIAPKRR